MFEKCYGLSKALIDAGLVLPALDYCLKCSHLFNVLDASGSIGVTERTAYILRVRQLAVAIAAPGRKVHGRGERSGDAWIVSCCSKSAVEETAGVAGCRRSRRSWRRGSTRGSSEQRLPPRRPSKRSHAAPADGARRRI